MAAAKKGKCLGGCAASSGHKTKLKQSIFFRYLCNLIKKTRKKFEKGQQNTLKAKNELNIFLRC
jgi:hypothetical protein